MINIRENIIAPLLESRLDTASIVLGLLFYKGFRPELLPEPIGFIGSNNSEVTLSASMVTSGSNVLLLTTTDRDIKLLGKAIDTPNGWGNLGIGS